MSEAFNQSHFPTQYKIEAFENLVNRFIKKPTKTYETTSCNKENPGLHPTKTKDISNDPARIFSGIG